MYVGGGKVSVKKQFGKQISKNCINHYFVFKFLILNQCMFSIVICCNQTKLKDLLLRYYKHKL